MRSFLKTSILRYIALFREFAAVGFLILLCLFLYSREPQFLSQENLKDILVQVSAVAIAAAGMTFVILTAGIDLSVGSILALAGCSGALAGNAILSGAPDAGVAVAGGSSDVHVGDGSAVRANVVANNRGAGILIAPGAELINGPPSYGSGNTAIGNVIFSNGGLAIDLTNSASVIFGDGENANDDRDNDSGTNTALNYPVILGGDIVDDHNTDLTVVWVGDQAAAPRSFQLSFAADEACRGYSGDARNPVTTSFISLPADETAQIIRVARIPGAPYYTATITDADGNTSEFGNCVNGISGLDVESAAVDNNVRTKVKDVLVTLDASGSQAAKSGAIAASTTVYVARHTENPSGSLFKDESAMSPGAVSILPVQIVGGYWSIVADELGDGSSVDVCIPASVSTVSTSDVVLVHRSPLTDGAWKPTDTTVQSVDAADYLCGADAGTFGDFALATSGLPLIPTPIDPVDGATNASIQPWLRWTSAGGSNSFDVEVSTASDFSSTVFSQDSIDGDSIVVASPLAPLTTYYWHVRATNVVGSSDWSETRTFLTGTGVAVEHDAPMVDDTALLPNYPNPFHEQTTVGLRLAATGEVRLELFDLLGRLVRVLERALDGPLAPAQRLHRRVRQRDAHEDGDALDGVEREQADEPLAAQHDLALVERGVGEQPQGRRVVQDRGEHREQDERAEQHDEAAHHADEREPQQPRVLLERARGRLEDRGGAPEARLPRVFKDRVRLSHCWSCCHGRHLGGSCGSVVRSSRRGPGRRCGDARSRRGRAGRSARGSTRAAACAAASASRWRGRSRARAWRRCGRRARGRDRRARPCWG